MSSKQNKGKNKGKRGNQGGNKGPKEQTEETTVPEVSKVEPTNDTINNDIVHLEEKIEKENASITQGENNNIESSHKDEPSTREGFVQPVDREAIEGHSNESEVTKIPPKVDQAIPIQIPPETTTTQIEVNAEQAVPTEATEEALQKVQNNVELSEIRQPSTEEVKTEHTEERHNLLNTGHDQGERPEASVAENNITEGIQLIENSNKDHVADERIQQDPRDHHQDLHEQKTQALLIDQHPPRQEQNHITTTQLLVDHNQHVHTHQAEPEVAHPPTNKSHQPEARRPDVKYRFQVRKAQQIKQEESQNQQENNITQSVEVLHDEGHIQEQFIPNEASPSSQRVIDINQPMDEEPTNKIQPKVEERTFRIVESYEISVNESNQLAVGESLQIKKQTNNEVKIPVKESLSFSDLNYSIEISGSQDHGRVQPHQSAESNKESCKGPQVPQIAEPLQAVREVEEPLLVSSPVQILVSSHSNKDSDVQNEQFYSIVPEPRQAGSSILQEAKVENEKPVHADIIESQVIHHSVSDSEVIAAKPIDIAVEPQRQQPLSQPQAEIIQQVIVEQEKPNIPDNAHQVVVVHALDVEPVHAVAEAAQPEVVVVNGEPKDSDAPMVPQKDDLSELALSQRVAEAICIDQKPAAQDKEKKVPSKLEKVAKGIISLTVGGLVAAGAILWTKNNRYGLAAAAGGAASVATYLLSR